MGGCRSGVCRTLRGGYGDSYEQWGEWFGDRRDAEAQKVYGDCVEAAPQPASLCDGEFLHLGGVVFLQRRECLGARTCRLQSP